MGPRHFSAHLSLKQGMLIIFDYLLSPQKQPQKQTSTHRKQMWNKLHKCHICSLDANEFVNAFQTAFGSARWASSKLHCLQLLANGQHLVSVWICERASWNMCWSACRHPKSFRLSGFVAMANLANLIDAFKCFKLNQIENWKTLKDWRILKIFQILQKFKMLHRPSPCDLLGESVLRVLPPGVPAAYPALASDLPASWLSNVQVISTYRRSMKY